MDQDLSCLVDTNILIYYFNGSLSSLAKRLVSTILKKEFNISVITQMEFLGFSRFNDKDKQKAEEFIAYANILPLSETVVERVIQLKQTNKIKLPDAIIAATTMCHDLKLVTHNVKDFVGLDLTIFDPLE